MNEEERERMRKGLAVAVAQLAVAVTFKAFRGSEVRIPISAKFDFY